MKEDQLIQALVSDLRPARRVRGAGRQTVLLLLWSAAVVAVAAGVAGIQSAPAFLPVIACTAVLVAAATGAVTSSFPGRESWRLAALVAAAATLAWLVEIALRTPPGTSAWGEVPWTKCARFTVGVAIAAAAGAYPLMRRGWPVRPRVTGALVLAAAAAAGALATTLECVSEAPLHVLVGHLGPVLAMTVLGAALAPRLFRSSHPLM